MFTKKEKREESLLAYTEGETSGITKKGRCRCTQYNEARNQPTTPVYLERSMAAPASSPKPGRVGLSRVHGLFAAHRLAQYSLPPVIRGTFSFSSLLPAKRIVDPFLIVRNQYTKSPPPIFFKAWLTSLAPY